MGVNRSAQLVGRVGLLAALLALATAGPARGAVEPTIHVVLHFGGDCRGEGTVHSETDRWTGRHFDLSWTPGRTVNALQTDLVGVERGEPLTVVLESKGGQRLWAREIGVAEGGFSTYELDASFDCSDGTVREVLPPTSTVGEGAAYAGDGGSLVGALMTLVLALLAGTESFAGLGPRLARPYDHRFQNG